MITTHIGETETLMSVKLSEPSDNQNDYVKAAKKEAETGIKDAEEKGTEVKGTEMKSVETEGSVSEN